MSEHLIQKAKKAILGDIQKTIAGTGNLEIKVEAHGGVEYFHTASQLPEVQSALRRKNLTATIRVIDPLSQVKKYILKNLRRVPRGAEITYQALEQNADLYYDAVALPEVKTIVEQKNITVNIQVLDKHGKPKPDIVVATYDDVISVRLDNIL